MVPLAVFYCLYSVHGKKSSGFRDGTLVLRGTKAQVFDLQLREKAADRLPAAAAAALHSAHAVAVAAAGTPGSLWQQSEQEEEVPKIVVGQFEVAIEDDRAAAVTEDEWVLGQRVGAEAAGGGKPKDAAGAPIPLDSTGKSCMRCSAGGLQCCCGRPDGRAAKWWWC